MPMFLLASKCSGFKMNLLLEQCTLGLYLKARFKPCHKKPLTFLNKFNILYAFASVDKVVAKE